MTEKFFSVDSIVEYLVKEYPSARFSASGNVNTGTGSQRWTTFFNRVKETIKPEMSKDMLIDNALSEKVQAAWRAATERRGEPGGSFAHLMPLIDIKNHTTQILYNPVTKSPSEMDVETFRILNKSAQFVPALLEFDPYDPDPYRMTDFEGIQVQKINLYSCPPWQDDRLPKTDAEAEKLKMPSIFEDYFKHFIPDETCRDFVLDWLHYCLTRRCETYLVLNGAKGVGKGVFFETIVKCIMGEKYCGLAPESALESNFNSFLSGKRVVCLDEVKANTDSRIAKLKRYVNEYQNVERKGVDADKTVRTYNSFIINNNEESDVKIEWDDRRFSVIDITKVKLEDAWPKEKIERLIKQPTATEIRELGMFILHRRPKVMVDQFHVWRGPHFYRLCYTSLPEWSRHIIDTLEEKTRHEVSYRDLTRTFSKKFEGLRFPRANKVQDFIKNYKHMGEYYLGEFISAGENSYIVPSSHYLPSDKTIEDSPL